MTRLYRQEDIQQILQIAIAHQAHAGEFTHDQLLEIAAELDIPPETLQAAEQEWLTQQGKLQKRQEFNAYRRQQLQQQVGKFAIVNTFLIVLDAVTTGGLSWSLYVLFFWGLGLGLKAWNLFHTQGEHYERAFQYWYRKTQFRRLADRVWSRLLSA